MHIAGVIRSQIENQLSNFVGRAKAPTGISGEDLLALPGLEDCMIEFIIRVSIGNWTMHLHGLIARQPLRLPPWSNQ